MTTRCVLPLYVSISLISAVQSKYMTSDPIDQHDVFEPTYLAPAFQRDDSLIGAIFGDISSPRAQNNPLVLYFIEEGMFSITIFSFSF